MKYLVQIKQNLTACDTIHKGPSTQRVLSEHLFENEAEAEQFYLSEKSVLRFAGLAGQYVTFPRQVDPTYKIPTYRCDYCGEGFESEYYTNLDGNFCSKGCFRNNHQDNSSSDEEQYYDDY